jgi:hypothetical protein
MISLLFFISTTPDSISREALFPARRERFLDVSS